MHYVGCGYATEESSREGRILVHYSGRQIGLIVIVMMVFYLNAKSTHAKCANQTNRPRVKAHARERERERERA